MAKTDKLDSIDSSDLQSEFKASNLRSFSTLCSCNLFLTVKKVF